MNISYQIEKSLSPEEFIAVLHTSTLAQRRPAGEPDRIAAMLQHGNLMVTARLDRKLIGVARSLTDFAFCTYLSDLAVDLEYQRQGVGRELIRQTKLAAPKAKLILLSAPAAVDYYPRIGMTRHDAAFYLDDINALK